MKDQYIQAIVRIIEFGAEIDSVLKGLTITLEKRGHKKLHRPILAGLLAQISQRKPHNKALVLVMQEKDVTSHMASIQSALKELEAPEEFEVITDDTLIGGSIVSFKGRQKDASYKQKLVSVYRSAKK